jgi:hypothetical protein
MRAIKTSVKLYHLCETQTNVRSASCWAVIQLFSNNPLIYHATKRRLQMKEILNDETHIVFSIIHLSDGMMHRMVTNFERRYVIKSNFWREK